MIIMGYLNSDQIGTIYQIMATNQVKGKWGNHNKFSPIPMITDFNANHFCLAGTLNSQKKYSR
jgi:hypothetical protein